MIQMKGDISVKNSFAINVTNMLGIRDISENSLKFKTCSSSVLWMCGQKTFSKYCEHNPDPKID